MTKPTVTDAMLDAAEQAYDTIAAIEHDAWCYTAPTRAAITAAIEASGLVEENARLREANLTLRRELHQEAADMLHDVYKDGRRNQIMAILKALNKEPTP
jgi:hypothetical protein